MCHSSDMETVGVREIRQRASEVLRRVEAGESFVVTVQGREVAELKPRSRGYWRTWEQVSDVFEGPADEELMGEIAALGGDLHDPWSDE